MSRQTVLGNGNMLVCFDKNGYVRDIYYPRAGLENHVVGQYHRIGISIDERFYWLENFKKESLQESATLKVTHTYTHEQEQISITIENIIYNEKNIFIRKIQIKNNKAEKRIIKLFLCQEFKIKENKYRNTAYYYPLRNVVIHYRGKRVFLVNLTCEDKGIDDYTIGLYDFDGKKGSYLAAEKINLPKNAVEHGPVDSVIAIEINLEALGTKTAYYTLIAGKKVEEVLEENEALKNKNQEHMIKSTSNYWLAWKNKRTFNFYDLSQDIIKTFYQSLFVIKTHIDDKDGGIIASSDSTMYMFGKDSYAYVWPRDAGYIAKAMLKAGYYSDAKKVLLFFSKTISKNGYIMHKFELDTSLGSSWHSWITNGEFEIPIQEDETAMIIHLLYEFYLLTRDIEFVEKFEETLIENPADFMCNFLDKIYNLPLKSYDLWEEDYRTYCYTSASVVDALEKAAILSEILGKSEASKKYSETAEKIRKAIIQNLYSPETKTFYKSIIIDNKQVVKIDKTLDSSTFYGLWYFNVIKTDDAMIKNFAEIIKNQLSQNGLFIRYENDNYFRKEGEKSNPWVITSLWYIQYLIESAKSTSELRQAEIQINNILKLKTSSGIFPEQNESSTLKPTSATPLIWSHACFVETVIMYMSKAQKLNMGESGLPK